jgi:hypothetical protein
MTLAMLRVPKISSAAPASKVGLPAVPAVTITIMRLRFMFLLTMRLAA